MASVTTLFAILVFGSVIYCFLLPPKYPATIPAVPFWVSLLPLVKKTDQKSNFKKYVEEKLVSHGAVKLFFGGQWNIVVQRPAYVAALFKDENLYEKHGNYRRIPHTIAADFFGEQVISSHGRAWRLYRSLVTKGLQNISDHKAMLVNAQRLRKSLTNAQLCHPGAGVTIKEFLQEYFISNTEQALLGSSSEVSANTCFLLESSGGIRRVHYIF